MTDFYTKNSVAIDEALGKILPTFIDIYNRCGNDTLIEYAYNLAEDIKEQSGLNAQVTCSKQKCSFCCHSTIYIAHGEKKYIQKRIKQHHVKPNRQRSKIQNSIGMNKDNESLVKWVDRACPFLTATDGKGDCSIYEIRPMVCRNHNSMAKDFNDCNVSNDYGRIIDNAQIVELEAITIALMQITQDGDYLTPIHKIL